MTVYVTRGSLRVGDQVVVELRKGSKLGGELLTVVQVSTVTRVEPSQYHSSEEMDEVEI